MVGKGGSVSLFNAVWVQTERQGVRSFTRHGRDRKYNCDDDDGGHGKPDSKYFYYTQRRQTVSNTVTVFTAKVKLRRRSYFLEVVE